MIRADLQANYESFEVGVSYRFNSYIQNVDQAFFDIEDFNSLGYPLGKPIAPLVETPW